ncbi:ribosome maturation factor RimM [Desulfurivibrio sp. D14AmB]|uniref:ribosome maturation factor RimM n=1 Tax=Desulfurivibrio sp. D14AmB TaxID=3374370 RepID=UPI00376EE6F9
MKIHATGALRAGLVEIGKIVKPQGIKGELKVMPLAGGPLALKDYRQLFLLAGADGGFRAYELLASRGSGEAVIVRLAGVDDRNGAETLRGALVAVEVGQLPPLPAGEVYWYQLSGLVAKDGDGREIGRVSDLLPTAARPILVISGGDGREILVPVHEEFMRWQAATAAEEAFLLLTPPPGLLELNG